MPPIVSTVIKSHPLAGKTFVMTGALNSMSRARAAARLEQLGATVGSQVRRETSFVIVGEEPGSRLLKAEAMAIPLLSEPAFAAMLYDTEDAVLDGGQGA